MLKYLRGDHYGRNNRCISDSPLKSALAVIRVSGADAIEIFGKIFSKDVSQTKSKKIEYGYIVDDGEIIDEVVALFRCT